jgi:PAS domain S-box-containing protein
MAQASVGTLNSSAKQLHEQPRAIQASADRMGTDRAGAATDVLQGGPGRRDVPERTALLILSGLLLATLAGFVVAQAYFHGLRRKLEVKARELTAELARREQAEKALSQRETHLHNVLLNADAVVFQLSPDGVITHIEGRALGSIGFDPATLTGRHVSEFFGDNPEVMGSLGTVLGGESVRYVTVIKGRHAAIMASPARDEGGRIEAVWGVATDITDRKDSEQRYRTLFDTARDAIVIYRDGRVVDCNPWTQTLSGYSREELLGKSPEEVAPPMQPGGVSTADMNARVMARAPHGPQLFDWVLRRKDGTLVHSEVSLTPMPSAGGNLLLAISRDMTDRDNLQEAMIRTEKMASLGSLAAGMAHEINNPLGIILQSAQGTLRRLDPDFAPNAEAAARHGVDLAQVRAYLEERNILRYLEGIREAGDRAASIVRGVLGFSRRNGLAREMADVNALVLESLALAANEYDPNNRYDFKRIAIVKDLSPGLPPLPCSPTQIKQVLLNLIRNAAQALCAAGTPDPVITLRTGLAQDHAVIEVADNGPGIPPDDAAKVFEPFFTTKKAGDGTGLGLSVSYFIVVENHGGRLDLSSRPGEETVFRVRLPLSPLPGPQAP